MLIRKCTHITCYTAQYELCFLDGACSWHVFEMAVIRLLLVWWLWLPWQREIITILCLPVHSNDPHQQVLSVVYCPAELCPSLQSSGWSLLIRRTTWLQWRTKSSKQHLITQPCESMPNACRIQAHSGMLHLNLYFQATLCTAVKPVALCFYFITA